MRAQSCSILWSMIFVFGIFCTIGVLIAIADALGTIALELDYAPKYLPLFQSVKGFIDLVQAIGPGDQLVKGQLA